MSPLHHAIVWIDHREAKVYRIIGNDESQVQVNSHHSLQRLHHRPGGWEAGGGLPEDGEFFGRVAATLDQSGGILVIGPGDARLAFKTYLDHLHPSHAPQVQTVERTAPPGEEELLALGRDYFPLIPVAAAHRQPLPPAS